VVAKQTPVVDAVDPYLSLIGLNLFYRSARAARRDEQNGLS
jgi:hypothetical protein